MASELFLENYLVLRKTYPRFSRRRSRLQVAPPESRTEHTYQSLLSEANEDFFHREYAIALENYLALRHKILVQSHPEMPPTPGGGGILAVDISKIKFNRIVELSRAHIQHALSDGRVILDLRDEPLVATGRFPISTVVRSFANLGLDVQRPNRQQLTDLRNRARDRVAGSDFVESNKAYDRAAKSAAELNDVTAVAQIKAERAAMMATYAAGRSRGRVLGDARTLFAEAEGLFREAGDTKAVFAMKANIANVQLELGDREGARKTLDGINGDPELVLATGSRVDLKQALVQLGRPALTTRLRNRRLPTTRTNRVYLVNDAEGWSPVSAVVASQSAAAPTGDQRLGILTDRGTKVVRAGEQTFEQDLSAQFYQPRITATTLEALGFFEELETNFVAYIPHLFFFVLPVAIGDTYMELGRFAAAEEEYRTAMRYSFLNRGIEAAYLWLKLARLNLRWGDQLFRRERPSQARTRYQQIIKNDRTVPVNSHLYKTQPMMPMRAKVREAVKELQGEASQPVNPQIVELVGAAIVQLDKIANHLNFLGLADDHVPILRYRYLQSVANYLADNAIQSERAFINFRVAAENQKLEMIQLESAVEVNRAGLAVEEKRVEDAVLETQAARQSREYSELRAANAAAALNDWNTLGWEMTRMNAVLSWASNAANDQDIKVGSVYYYGEEHDFDTDVEQFYDIVGEWREWHNFELQKRRLERQNAEIAAEVGVAQTREAQANVRLEIQQLNVKVAEKRLEGAEEMLDYARDRTFDEDLWFQLAAKLQDLTRSYLDMAIYAAFLMERAYDLEFDRNLDRIRFDYGLGGMEGLLGGDHLKRDIAAFTLDYLQNATKKNPVRTVLSLRDEFPSAFATFVQEGLLPFRTHLEIFDRRYPGTFRRKIKKIEVFIEGLLPVDGLHGALTHQGVATDWRELGGAWQRYTRIVPPERMVLSSYQLRRDVVVFQPSEEQLGLFENLGPEGNWLLELPRSANNIDYEAISDIKVVIYFDADHSTALAAHVAAELPANGGRALVLSARFHFPDEYYRLDADRQVTFDLPSSRFAYNHADLSLQGIGVRLLGTDGSSLANHDISVTRLSDDSTVNGTTDGEGLLGSHPTTMAPFAAWQGDTPVKSFAVALADGIDPTTVGDIQLSITYDFAYRADGTLPT